MDMRERMELKKKYAALPDEEIINMLLEGKDSYVEEAYELLLSEARARGIEGKLKEETAQEEIPVEPVLEDVKEEPETFAQVMIVNSESDLAFLKSLLEEERILYFFQDLSLKGANLPVSLMLAESQVKKVMDLLRDFKPADSIALW